MPKSPEVPEIKPEIKKDEFGGADRIEVPELAEEMAAVEDKYRKKALGVFPASEKRVAEGEAKAAEALEESGHEISYDELPRIVRLALSDQTKKFGDPDGRGELTFDRVVQIDGPGQKKMFRVKGGIYQLGSPRRGDFGTYKPSIHNPYTITIEVDGEKILSSKMTYEGSGYHKYKKYVQGPRKR